MISWPRRVQFQLLQNALVRDIRSSCFAMADKANLRQRIKYCSLELLASGNVWFSHLSMLKSVYGVFIKCPSNAVYAAVGSSSSIMATVTLKMRIGRPSGSTSRTPFVATETRSSTMRYSTEAIGDPCGVKHEKQTAWLDVQSK